MKEWNVVRLEGPRRMVKPYISGCKVKELGYMREEFDQPQDVIDYMKSLIPRLNGKRLLTICPRNDLHHWTFGFVWRSNAKAYVHIDAHPDDSTCGSLDENYGHLGFGSFVQYMPKYAKVKAIRMIGPDVSWCETHEEFKSYREERDYLNVLRIVDLDKLGVGRRIDHHAMKNFFSGTDDIYLSIDLDVLNGSDDNKNLSLTEDELFEIVEWLAKHKRIRGADIYPNLSYPRYDLDKPLSEKITSF